MVAIVAVLFACLIAASADAAPTAFVAGSSNQTLNAIATGSNALLGGSIKVGADPTSVAITPNGRYAYVTNNEEESVTVIDTAARLPVGAKPIKVGENPAVVAISPNGATAYVSDRGRHEVSVISTATDTVVGSIETAEEPFGIAVSPDGTRLYVGTLTESTVEVFDTATGLRVGQPIEVGIKPRGIGFTPNGRTAYVIDEGGEEVSAIAAATGAVTKIPVGEEPTGLAIAPNGEKAFVVNHGSGTVSVINTAINQVVTTIPVGGAAAEPWEVAVTPDGAKAYVTQKASEEVVVINARTNELTGEAIRLAGGPTAIAITPDQSPTAAFTAPSATATQPSTFDGSASTDPDGLISAFEWSFGEGAVGTGPSVSHTYGKAGTYDTKLTVVDNEGCGEAEVFTGRTAYCSGALASVTHPVTVSAAPVVCSAKFRVIRLIHRRKNGTVKMQLKLPGAGFVLLFGKKVHAVTRKAKKAGTMWLTIHARVEVAKRLKKVHHAPVRTRITFTPNAGCGFKTVHRSFSLLRRKNHRH